MICSVFSSMLDLKTKSDLKLLQLAQDGNREAFGVLADRYRVQACHYAQKSIQDFAKAEDIVQDSLCSVWAHIKIVKNFWAYTKTTIWHGCIDERRKPNREFSGKDFQLETPVEKCMDDFISSDDLDLWNCICEKTVEFAGFLQPKPIKELFFQALKGGILDTDKIIDIDGRNSLSPLECLDFLLNGAREVFGTSPQTTHSLQEYRDEIKKYILELISNASHDVITLLTDVHMITVSWPGWPLTPLEYIVYPSKTPARILPLCKLLDSYQLRQNPMRFEDQLKTLRDNLQILRVKWEWPHRSNRVY